MMLFLIKDFMAVGKKKVKDIIWLLIKDCVAIVSLLKEAIYPSNLTGWSQKAYLKAINPLQCFFYFVLSLHAT